MTLHRVLACVSFLGLLACARSDAAPKANRPAATTEAIVAHVLHVSGQTTVTPRGGAPFVAAVQHDLVPFDRLEPAEGAFAILALENGHVVRVDDAGALDVKDILMLRAPPTGRPVGEQLALLLEPTERRPDLEQGVVERAAAWRHMRRAGETSGAREEAKKEDSGGEGAGGGVDDADDAVRSSSEAVRGRVAAGAPAPAKRRGPAREVASPKQLPAAPSPAAGLPAPIADMAQNVAPPPPPPPPTVEPGVVAAAGASPRVAAPLATSPFLGGDVRGCLTETATATGVDEQSVVLWLQVRGRVVTRVRFAGALPVGACAAGLAGRSVDVADGWLVVKAGPTP